MSDGSHLANQQRCPVVEAASNGRVVKTVSFLEEVQRANVQRLLLVVLGLKCEGNACERKRISSLGDAFMCEETIADNSVL